MFSMPPARTTSDSPRATCWPAETMACKPEPHTRLMVMPGTLLGRPALRATWRPGFMPWPAWSTLPAITWSTRSPATPERDRTSLATVAPNSVAGMSFRVPPNVPIAVRNGVETTTSAPSVRMLTAHYSFRLRDLNLYSTAVRAYARRRAHSRDAPAERQLLHDPSRRAEQQAGHPRARPVSHRRRRRRCRRGRPGAGHAG